MNRLLEEEIRFQLSHPANHRAVSEGQEEFLADLQSCLEGRPFTADDITRFVLMMDVDYRSVFSLCFRTDWHPINEKWIRKCVEDENLQELMYIASECMIRKDGGIYLCPHRRFDENNRVSDDILEMMRNLFLSKGYPINAMHVSTPSSFYSPDSLDSMICCEKDFRTYMCGRLYKTAPYIDRMSIAVFNSLNEADKERVLGWWLESYRNFRIEKRNSEYLTVTVDETGTLSWVWKADLEALETDSSLKKELIDLQNSYYGCSEEFG